MSEDMADIIRRSLGRGSRITLEDTETATALAASFEFWATVWSRPGYQLMNQRVELHSDKGYKVGTVFHDGTQWQVEFSASKEDLRDHQA